MNTRDLGGTRDLRPPETTLIARVPQWLWDLLLAESKRRGTSYMRLVRGALERELVHGGRQVDQPTREE